MNALVTVGEIVFLCLWVYFFFIALKTYKQITTVSADLRQIEIDISAIKNILAKYKK